MAHDVHEAYVVGVAVADVAGHGPAAAGPRYLRDALVPPVGMAPDSRRERTS